MISKISAHTMFHMVDFRMIIGVLSGHRWSVKRMTLEATRWCPTWLAKLVHMAPMTMIYR